MVSWMCNNVKDVKTEIDNTLRVSPAFAPFSLNLKTITRKARWRKEQKSPCVVHWNFRLCPIEHVPKFYAHRRRIL
ncbi:MAG: hypothetical protein U9N46_09555 [Euryarchaeota archaeon]|nr:hypothetical protein [Euryarchaeota archaeon]